jgi:diacylglycerol kinase (ATP)
LNPVHVMAKYEPKIMFVINPGAGAKDTDWKNLIREFFADRAETIELFDMPDNCDPREIKKAIEKSNAEKVIAVGGDGTVKLVAESLIGSDRVLGILPGGSANGMAREFGIPADGKKALETIIDGQPKKIHLVKVNDELCIHLSDIGFNAWVVHKFEANSIRGMRGYVKAAWNVLWRHRKMQVQLRTDENLITREAVMVVIANATQYGNGVVINPKGNLYDNLFEVVIVKKVSFVEIFKMRFTNWKLNPAKTEVFQTTELDIKSRYAAHFQVDGEAMGKVKEVHAELLPGAVNVIVPEEASGK